MKNRDAGTGRRGKGAGAPRGRRLPLDFKQAFFSDFRLLIQLVTDMQLMTHKEHRDFERNGYEPITDKQFPPL